MAAPSIVHSSWPGTLWMSRAASGASSVTPGRQGAGGAARAARLRVPPGVRIPVGDADDDDDGVWVRGATPAAQQPSVPGEAASSRALLD